MNRLISKEQLDYIKAEEHYRNRLECDERSFRACLYERKKSEGNVQAFLLEHCIFFDCPINL